MSGLLWVIFIVAAIAAIWWLQFKRKMRSPEEGGDCGCGRGSRCKSKKTNVSTDH